MSKKTDATETMTAATNEAIEKGQEMFTKTTATAEKAVEGMIEFNSAMFKGGEVLFKKAYDNYLSNIALTFDNAKALNKTGDMAEFSKVASEKMTKAGEALQEQSKEYMELTSKVAKETMDTAKAIYSKSFSAA